MAAVSAIIYRVSISTLEELKLTHTNKQIKEYFEAGGKHMTELLINKNRLYSSSKYFGL